MNYSKLPYSGQLILKTGEVTEFRARLVRTAEDVTIIEGAVFRDGDEFIGSMTIKVSKDGTR